MLPQQYCLRWKHHHSNVQSMFAQLLEKERFCDVTLYCSNALAAQLQDKTDLVDPSTIKGVSVRAHRVVLAACSELLGSLLGAHESQGEPVLVIDGAQPAHVRALLDYMYTGEMNVHHSELPTLLKTAEELRIKGLTDIRWNNKDEPPDTNPTIVTSTNKFEAKSFPKPVQSVPVPVQSIPTTPIHSRLCQSPEEYKDDKLSLNGGPPPLIKLLNKEKSSPLLRMDNNSDSDVPSPKRVRMMSGTSHTDDDEREQEWKHGNMDITAERVWSNRDPSECSNEEESPSESEWDETPADIGSFLDTRLQIDGDNSAGESSSDAHLSNLVVKDSLEQIKTEIQDGSNPATVKPTIGPKSGPHDTRFTDVIKLNDYLRHGRRPQFWEEDYVKRVMEAVRLKKLEMKQAAEILGVSYGTLYGRYRDVYGCINRPYRNSRDFCWSGKSPGEVLDRLQRGEIPTDVAAQALGVSARDLYAHLPDVQAGMIDKDFEPIPIEIDPYLKMKAGLASTLMSKTKKVERKKSPDDLATPTTPQTTVADKSSPSKWPSIRVSNLDTLGASTSGESHTPSLLMKSRPDLTIVAARRPDSKSGESCT